MVRGLAAVVVKLASSPPAKYNLALHDAEYKSVQQPIAQAARPKA